MIRSKIRVVAGDSPTGPILEAAAAWYESLLGDPGRGRRARRYLAQRGIDPSLIARFRVGYAPIGWTELSDELMGLGFTRAQIRAAGLSARSHRRGDRTYDRFRSRIIFPIVEPQGAMVGFAGLALHPGPSWPRWLVSPDGPEFSRGQAMFGLDRAVGAIRETEQALVLRDCVRVLQHHAAGHPETVALIRSSMTTAHVTRLHELGAARISRDPAVVPVASGQSRWDA